MRAEEPRPVRTPNSGHGGTSDSADTDSSTRGPNDRGTTTDGTLVGTSAVQIGGGKVEDRIAEENNTSGVNVATHNNTQQAAQHNNMKQHPLCKRRRTPLSSDVVTQVNQSVDI